MAGEEGVRPLASLARICDAIKAAAVASKQPFRASAIRAGGHAVVAWYPSGGLASLSQDEIDRAPVDALETELLADGTLAARPGAIARLDPRPRERLVVEHPEFEHPRDRTLDEVGLVARASEAASDLGDRPRPWLEEPRSRFEHDRGIIDLGLACLAFGE